MVRIAYSLVAPYIATVEALPTPLHSMTIIGD